MYEREINEQLLHKWYDLKYQYYFAEYGNSYKASKDNWSDYDFAILYDDKVIGCIHFDIARATNRADGFTAINFSENKISFGIALKQIMDDIFIKYNFNKLNFNVIIGNPIERTYDKMVSKYNGRIVGIKKNHTKVFDGTICDLKMYEILKEEYLMNKKEN